MAIWTESYMSICIKGVSVYVCMDRGDETGQEITVFECGGFTVVDAETPRNATA